MNKESNIALASELMGTWVLASVALTVSGSGIAGWFTALSVGFCLAVLVGTIGSKSGAHVNPAVTLGLWSLKKIQTSNALAYIAAQMAGGLLALATYHYLMDSNAQWSFAGEFDARIFFAEMLGALVFGFGIASAVIGGLDKMQKAFTIGFSLFLGAIIASAAAAGFLNPAVALAADSLSWAYLLGPVVGMVVGMQLYSILTPVATKKRK